ncbi:HIT family protein [uncultured Desulfuromusa sp.]|uniref:HIT family protein n=1 Tax=uncultured Desulfuromusa sp. TaxID=219183 RepID=UPI003749283C
MTTECPFCYVDEARQLFSNDFAISIADTFPVTRGHCLIIPKRHFTSFFESTEEERTALWVLADQTRQYLITEYAPDGFNIGINDGVSAGQTIMHLHIHLIPRYLGDSADPRGGVRWIIPKNAPYWKKEFGGT